MLVKSYTVHAALQVAPSIGMVSGMCSHYQKCWVFAHLMIQKPQPYPIYRARSGSWQTGMRETLPKVRAVYSCLIK